MNHTVIKHLKYLRTTYYIQDTINWYLPNIYFDCEGFVNKCIKCRIQATHIKKGLFSILELQDSIRDIKLI